MNPYEWYKFHLSYFSEGIIITSSNADKILNDFSTALGETSGLHTHTHTNELQPEGLPSKFIQYSVASLKITHTLTTCKKQVVEMYYAI